MTTTPQTPAGWYPDPTGQFEQRYWDGLAWTEHVARQGQQAVSPLDAARPVHTTAPDKVVRQVQQQAGVGPMQGGTGHLLDEPVLVVNQKAKLIELTQEFAVYDQQGRQLGWVVQVGQSALKKALRFVSSVDQYLTHRFEVRDMQGTVLMTLTRPAKFLKSKVIVGTPDGREVGTIRQENAIGKIRFAFEVGGQRVGGIQAENWRAWNFAILDAQGTEIARITKTWEGLAKTMFTTADNYVVQIHQRLPDPLRTLVVASALTVDTALKQDQRGFG
jgi:uncharacterized protein YxjI